MFIGCEEGDVLCRPGSDLLSQGLSHSTIGAEEFNGRVRDGIGFRLLAKTTRPAKDIGDKKQAEQDCLGNLAKPPGSTRGSTSQRDALGLSDLMTCVMWTLKMRAIK